MCAEPQERLSPGLGERFRAILESKALTLYEVSQKSASLYGRSSPYFLPHNLYYDLASGSFRPSIYQFAALSHFSNYRLDDWLNCFGFRVDDIPRLQMFLPSLRTVVLNSAVSDPFAWILWLQNRTLGNAVQAMAPLSELLWFNHRRQVGSLTNVGSKGFIYARIGREDALAFPELLPGSIVRANRNVTIDRILSKNGTTSDDLFLIEHGKGLCCCRLTVTGDNNIVPISRQLPFAQVEFQVPHEAKLLGIVDFEIRPLVHLEQAEVSKELAMHWKAKALVEPVKLGQLLQTSRSKMGMSLRDASTASRKAADILGDAQYFISTSSLSDYEALETSPRHVHKILTLCSMYGLEFSRFLKSAGIDLGSLGKEPIPDAVAGKTGDEVGLDGVGEIQPMGFLRDLLKECGDIPFFLRHSLEEITGLQSVSLEDCFWVGAEKNPLHPYLAKALVVVVNRRKKKPLHFRSKPLWEQPLYVISKRDGTHLCACCGLENGYLLVHPYSRELYRPIRLRYHDEAEVVGQVVTIAKRI